MLINKTWTKSNAALLIIAVVLALFPFVNDSRMMLILMSQIFIFGIYAMSYDILLGYVGIVSFGHCMFFGIGAYAVGTFMKIFGPSIGMLLLAFLVGIVLAAILSYVVGILSLRLKSHFYAMLTLAVSGLVLVVAEKWRSLTNGSEGFAFPIPELLMDRQTFYFICLVALIIAYLLLRRFTVSPLGKVLQAIRENEQRTESLGYETVHYKVIASVVAGVAAACSGGLYVIMLRFVSSSVLAVDVTLNALLMTIIGGVGTLVGAVLGSAIIEFAHHWLTELAKIHPIFERWVIFFGLLYIIVVLVFPRGIVGTIALWRSNRKTKVQGKKVDSSWQNSSPK
ncbi:branched-chain amino acid ABC transporter permease [Paenibacillus sp. N1-5-1-14]|uniref:branched-chain amino acid ABC transporter permease n=1 Tax=Paenibacillus radicibacter TaxID=2972488 RepID=UPI0021596DE8|nr:branched-chain amino acid ABC transporter permease [Paenibacillus radicibacter]MCR8644159.1 branched-chain amino acid ABC transporter permease [Paenibacillus radicibacter]